jgi:hypothetical protein
VGSYKILRLGGEREFRGSVSIALLPNRLRARGGSIITLLEALLWQLSLGTIHRLRCRRKCMIDNYHLQLLVHV